MDSRTSPLRLPQRWEAPRLMELAHIRQNHPSYKVGHDMVEPGRVRYWAIAARTDVHPVVVISADLAELASALDPCDQQSNGG
jgi:hypothetical protein